MFLKPVDRSLSELFADEDFMHIKRIKLDNGSYGVPSLYFSDDDPGNGLYATTGNIHFTRIINCDVINEETSGSGVTIDGVLIKDAAISGNVNTDTINEETIGAGVNIDGVLLKDSEVYTDNINEKTPSAGVTIDGVLCKDNGISLDTITELTPAGGIVVDADSLTLPYEVTVGGTDTTTLLVNLQTEAVTNGANALRFTGKNARTKAIQFYNSDDSSLRKVSFGRHYQVGTIDKTTYRVTTAGEDLTASTGSSPGNTTVKLAIHDSNGYVGLSSTATFTPSARVHIKDDTPFKLDNGSGSALFTVTNATGIVSTKSYYAPAGTNTLPAYTFSADDNTGIYNPTDNNLALVTQGQTKVLIDTANVTISNVALKVDTINETTSAAGVTIDGVLLKDSQVSTDTINEKTAAAGVTIDGVLLKDSQVSTNTINEKTFNSGVTIDSVLVKDNAITCDYINCAAIYENSLLGPGVYVEGVYFEDSVLSTDTINEQTSAAGVTIDGVLLKDNAVTVGSGGGTPLAEFRTNETSKNAETDISSPTNFFNTTVNMSIYTTRINNTVNISWKGCTGTRAAGSAVCYFNAAISSSYYPSGTSGGAGYYSIVRVRTGATNQAGLCNISEAGVLSFFATVGGASFAGSTTATIYAGGFSYEV